MAVIGGIVHHCWTSVQDDDENINIGQAYHLMVMVEASTTLDERTI